MRPSADGGIADAFLRLRMEMGAVRQGFTLGPGAASQPPAVF
jgi:hypothetical protein